MSLVTVRRRMLVLYLAFALLLLALLLVCCIFPNWWVCEYERKNVSPSRPVKIDFGLWKTCRVNDGELKECKNYQDDTEAHNIKGVLIALSIVFSLKDKAKPLPPSWTIPTSQNYEKTLLDYGWTFMLLCVAGGVCFLNLVLATSLLCMVIIHKKDYNILPARSTSASSKRSEFLNFSIDFNENFVKNEADKKKKKDRPRNFTYYNNHGFLPDGRTITPSSGYISDSPSRLDGLTSAFERKIATQSRTLTNSGYHKRKYNVCDDYELPTHNPIVHYGGYENDSRYYSNMNETEMANFQKKKDKSQQTSPVLNYTLYKQSDSRPTEKTLHHTSDHQRPNHAPVSYGSKGLANQAYFIPAERRSRIQRQDGKVCTSCESQKNFQEVTSFKAVSARSDVISHAHPQIVSVSRVKVNMKNKEPRVIKIAGKNHGHPVPDYE